LENGTPSTPTQISAVVLLQSRTCYTGWDHAADLN